MLATSLLLARVKQNSNALKPLFVLMSVRRVQRCVKNLHVNGGRFTVTATFITHQHSKPIKIFAPYKPPFEQGAKHD